MFEKFFENYMDRMQITSKWSFYRCKKAYENVPKFDSIIEGIPWIRPFIDV